MNNDHGMPTNLQEALSEAESLISKGRLEDAALIYERLCHSLPKEASLHHVLGLVRLSQGAMPQAISAYERAVSLDPNQALWWRNLGLANLKSGALSIAKSCFRQALCHDPNDGANLTNLGITLRAQGDFRTAVDVLQKALQRCPEKGEAIASLYAIHQQTCQWDKLKSDHLLLDQLTQGALDRGMVPDEPPLLNIRRSSDLSLNQSIARSWSRRAANRALSDATPYKHRPFPKHANRITLGYLSYDFRDHPVAHQLLPLFGLHDRRRFKVLAFSIGPPDDSDYGRSIRDDCDAFIDLHATGISQASKEIKDHRVDILIDLMGHTRYNRMEILALHPAPIQVGYLGFLGTSGADFIDYIIADAIVVPESDNRFYTEKIIRMPHCYQMNHSPVLNAKVISCRRDCGLPDDHFVFCCFNKAYKIDWAIFNTWMRILHQVPESVLWLYHNNDAAVDSLRSGVQSCGVDPRRLIFSAKCALDEHLDRLRLADLSLDTPCYNGGATTSNALQAGVPVLALLGNHWVSRMSASHLMALGLDELVVHDMENYEQTAVDLANSPERLQHLRTTLKKNAVTHPLFDTQGFVRDIEKAYAFIYQRYCNEIPPGHISLSTLG